MHQRTDYNGIPAAARPDGYNDISRLLDEFFVDMAAVMIPTVPSFKER